MRNHIYRQLAFARSTVNTLLLFQKKLPTMEGAVKRVKNKKRKKTFSKGTRCSPRLAAMKAKLEAVPSTSTTTETENVSLEVEDEIIYPPVLSLLVGQRFRAKLIEIESLEDFSILLSGCSVKCCIYKLTVYNSFWVFLFKTMINDTVIVHVDDFQRNRLEVTLYDERGIKIDEINGNDSAEDAVPRVCPYLLEFPFLCGTVSHVQGDVVFVQPLECFDDIDALEVAMNEYYNNTLPENLAFSKHDFIAAKSSDDNWYRAQIIDFICDLATVYYLDNGKSEVLERNAIRYLIDDFTGLQTMCKAVNNDGPFKDITRELDFAYCIMEPPMSKELKICLISSSSTASADSP